LFCNFSSHQNHIFLLPSIGKGGHGCRSPPIFNQFSRIPKKLIGDRKMPRNKFRPDYAKLYPGIHISAEVMAVLKKGDRKEEYQEYDLKRKIWEIDQDTQTAKCMLIIVKLPFAFPDPISEYERTQYRDFAEFKRNVIDPDMQIRKKQGGGMAHRTESDISLSSAPATKRARSIARIFPLSLSFILPFLPFMTHLPISGNVIN
jgi:hypothetical protein